MSDENTTTAGMPANPVTLNANELWENFLATASIDDVNGYKDPVRDLIDWQYGTPLIDDVVIRLADDCADEKWSDDPAGNLKDAVNDLRNAADCVEMIMNAFADYKREHVANANDPNCNQFRVPDAPANGFGEERRVA